MEPISEELVEETWQEIAELGPDRGSKEMTKMGNNQPNLVAFMVEFTDELNQEVKELALYMFFNVYRMFEEGYGKKIKKISPEEIIECYERNEKLIESLEGVHDKFHDRIAKVQLSGQPYVMKYVLDTLFEVPDEEDPVALTEEDTGFLFLLLKTVIDILNKTTDA